jgi:hypothetical protein
MITAGELGEYLFLQGAVANYKPIVGYYQFTTVGMHTNSDQGAVGAPYRTRVRDEHTMVWGMNTVDNNCSTQGGVKVVFQHVRSSAMGRLSAATGLPDPSQRLLRQSTIAQYSTAEHCHPPTMILEKHRLEHRSAPLQAQLDFWSL